MIADDGASAADPFEGGLTPEFVPVESLSRRPRRRFVLPWEELPGGVVRFIDSRDTGRLDRVMRRGFIAFVWAFSLLWLGGALAAAVFMRPGTPAGIFVILLSLGVTFGAVGEWMRRGGRPRAIDVDAHGRMRVGGPGAGRSAGTQGHWNEASLELRPFTIYADRESLEGFALLIGDGTRKMMLCAGESRDECIAALERMPAQVGSLRVDDSERPIIGAALVTRRLLEKLMTPD